MAKIIVSQETRELLKEMEKFSLKVSSTTAKSRKFLVDAGICTEKGNLKMAYR